MQNKKKRFGIGLGILLVLAGIIYFVGKPVPKDDWNRLNTGLSLYEVEQELGTPDAEYVEARTMLDCVNLDRQHYEDFRNNLFVVSDDDLANRMIEQVDKELEMLEMLHQSISLGEDIRVHEYSVGSYGDATYEFAYFYKGDLVHRSGYIVGQFEE